MGWPSQYLDSFLAVARASFADNGLLLEANRGFMRLIEESEHPVGTLNVAQFFIQPDFVSLVQAPASDNGEIYQGRLTIGDYHGKIRTLSGIVWRHALHIHLVAEHDIEDLEFVQNIVLDTNREYAKAQLQLTQMNLNIERLNRELDIKVAERTRELRDALSLAEEASAAKSIFLSNMSHEMLTPMHGIMGMTNLALRRATDSRQIDQLGELNRSSQRLLDTIKNALAISKLESERLTLELAEFTLASIFERLKIHFEPELTAKGLQFDINSPKIISNLEVYGDSVRLLQILQNIVGNAIKFTPQGSIVLTIMVVAATPEDERDFGVEGGG